MVAPFPVGAHAPPPFPALLPSQDDESAFEQFSASNIDEILASSSTKVSYDATASSGSVFSKAAFIAEEGQEVDMDDPEFWTKILPEMQARDPELAEAYIKRKSKQVKRFGMVELDDQAMEEELSFGAKKQKKEEDLAKRAARKALAHVRPHAQSGRLGEAAAGHQQLVGLRPKAWGRPPRPGEATHHLGSHRAAVVLASGPAKPTDVAASDHHAPGLVEDGADEL